MQNDRIVIAIDQSLILLEDENKSECNFLNFGAKIECLIVTDSGNLVICALSDGNIHGVHIKGIAVFNV